MTFIVMIHSVTAAQAHWHKVNSDSGRVRIRGPGSREPRRKSVAALRHRSFAQEQIMPLAGAETQKPDLYAAATCTKVRPYLSVPRYRTAAKDASYPLGGFALRPGCDPEAANSQSLIRLLLFL